MTKCVFCGLEELEKLDSPKIIKFAIGDRRECIIGDQDIHRVICKRCGGISFAQNSDYMSVIKQVFESYSVLIEKSEDLGSTRQQDVIERLFRGGIIKEKGKILDIGCGGGEFLTSFHKAFPKWQIHGMDIGTQFKNNIEKIGVFFENIDTVRGTYDLVTMNSVLYGVENPMKLLQVAHQLLSARNGFLFIYETNVEVNPFATCAIDMRNVLYKEFMIHLTEDAGFIFVDDVYEEGKKEYGIIAKIRSIADSGTQEILFKMKATSWYEHNRKLYFDMVSFLNKVIEILQQKCKTNKRVGIFGTSIAAIWTKEIIDSFSYDNDLFFVEEDEDISWQVCGLPVLRPNDLSGKACVFFPFAGYLGKKIVERLKKAGMMQESELIVF